MYFRKSNLVAGSARKIKLLILAFSWIFSICIGYILARSVRELPFSLMSRIVFEPVSIVGPSAVIFLPIILSTIAVRFSASWFIYMICAWKGVCYGFSICQLLIAYHDAAWLLGALVFFSDSCMLIPLFFFWIRHVDGTRLCLRRDSITLLLIGIVVGCIDCFMISPFIMGLTG